LIAFKKGDISLHRRTVTLTAKSVDGKPGQQIRLRSVERVEIRDVTTKGDATIVTACISMEIERNGSPEKIDKAHFPETTQVFGRTGMLLHESEGSDVATDPLIVAVGVLANMPAPQGSIRRGAVWHTVIHNRLVPHRPVTVKSEFLGAETLWGIPAMRTAFTFDFAHTAKSPLAEEMHITGERALDVATGRVVKFHAEIRNAAFTVGGGATIGIADILDELVVPGANDKNLGGN